MKTCYIMRGIAGSGKSTKARELAGESGVIHSTDSFFMRNGVCEFNPKLLDVNHRRNLEAFKRSIRAGIITVVADNCNHRVAHFLPYIEFARIYGYQIEIIEMKPVSAEAAASRSLHSTPIATVERMLQTWEPYVL